MAWKGERIEAQQAILLGVSCGEVDKSKHPELWPLSGPERAFLEYGGDSMALFRD